MAEYGRHRPPGEEEALRDGRLPPTRRGYERDGLSRVREAQPRENGRFKKVTKEEEKLNLEIVIRRNEETVTKLYDKAKQLRQSLRHNTKKIAPLIKAVGMMEEGKGKAREVMPLKAVSARVNRILAIVAEDAPWIHDLDLMALHRLGDVQVKMVALNMFYGSRDTGFLNEDGEVHSSWRTYATLAGLEARLLGELGLTPLGRVKIKAEVASAADDLAGALSRGQVGIEALERVEEG